MLLDQCFFVEDNARPHMDQLINEYLECKYIRKMNWLAISLSLNPIEPIWDAVERRLVPRDAFQPFPTFLARVTGGELTVSKSYKKPHKKYEVSYDSYCQRRSNP